MGAVGDESGVAGDGAVRAPCSEGGARSGDDAIGDLHRQEYVELVRLAWFLVGSMETAEDIAQEAFARMLSRKVRTPVLDPTAYLRRSVVNLCRSRMRHHGVLRRHTGLGAGTPPSQRSPEDAAVGHDVRSALRALPRRQREAVVLRYYGELTDVEVARAMGASVGSVKTHLHRAIATLSELLQEQR